MAARTSDGTGTGNDSLASARRYLASLIERTKAERRTRLPPVKQIAVAAGVSHALVSDVIAELKRAGTVHAGPRRGIELAGATRDNPAPVLHQESRRWRQAAAHLRRDLADGFYGYRPLPSQKELMGRYHVSKATMRMALCTLAAEEVLLPAGKTYRLSPPARAAGGNTIVLFARGANSGELLAYTPRVPLQLNALEQNCLARNVQLQIVPCSYRAGERLSFPGWERGSLSESFDLEQVLGFVVWHMGLDATFTRNLVHRLHGLKRPVAVFSERQEDAVIPGLKVGSTVRRYATQTDFQAGAAVARFLLSRGHRRVCCWSDREDLAWAQQREAGVRHAFAEAGVENGVEHIWAFAAGEYSAGREEFALTADLQGAIAAVTRKWGIVPRDGRLIEATNYPQLSVYWEWAANRLESPMRQKLRDETCTAWIGMNDRMAVECLRFLRASRAKVPRRLSLIGFDDSYEAAVQRMSSYNFNGAAAMNRVVDFLLWPKAPVAKADEGEPVEINGFVHERATTGPAARR